MKKLTVDEMHYVAGAAPEPFNITTLMYAGEFDWANYTIFFESTSTPYGELLYGGFKPHSYGIITAVGNYVSVDSCCGLFITPGWSGGYVAGTLDVEYYDKKKNSNYSPKII